MEGKAGKSQVLWEKPAGPTPASAPRKPKETGNSASQEGDIKSTLRAEAPEFVPTWFKPSVNEVEEQFQNVHITVGEPAQLVKHNAQSRLTRIKPPNPASEQQCSYSASSEDLNGYCHESIDLVRLKQLISSLIKYPGRFDDLLMVFMETIYPHFSDIIAMSKITELLMKQAIDCPNFRYNGARLCWHLEQKCPSFRAELHLKCQKQLTENPNRQNVMLFIAELYTQLPHDSLYGMLLIDALKGLVWKNENDNIKCVCQALKLTGFSLELHHKAALNELFAKLWEFKNVLSGSALEVLNSVINLRLSNWGRNSSETSYSDSSSEYDQDCEEIVNGILYETEGNFLTNEEQEFLVAHAVTDEYAIDNEDPDALYDPEPEMDEEIQAAFEEFVKLSKDNSWWGKSYRQISF